MTEIFFIATRPDIVKAVGDRIYFAEADALEARTELLRAYPATRWRIYRAYVGEAVLWGTAYPDTVTLPERP